MHLIEFHQNVDTLHSASTSVDSIDFQWKELLIRAKQTLSNEEQGKVGRKSWEGKLTSNKFSRVNLVVIKFCVCAEDDAIIV